MPRLISASSSGVGKTSVRPERILTVLYMVSNLSVVRLSETKDVHRVAALGEHHAEQAIADRRIADLNQLAVVPCIRHCHHLRPVEITRLVERDTVLLHVDGALSGSNVISIGIT